MGRSQGVVTGLQLLLPLRHTSSVCKSVRHVADAGRASLLVLCCAVPCCCRDTFNPATANSLRFSNRGGSIFASQLAQHLGLNPTGAEDTPEGCTAQQQQQQQLPAQSAWCSAFRQGRQPALAELRAASSCPVQGFGLLEASVPDNCAMAFSPTQVAALQAAVAMHRPKLIAACAAR